MRTFFKKRVAKAAPTKTRMRTTTKPANVFHTEAAPGPFGATARRVVRQDFLAGAPTAVPATSTVGTTCWLFTSAFADSIGSLLFSAPPVIKPDAKNAQRAKVVAPSNQRRGRLLLRVSPRKFFAVMLMVPAAIRIFFSIPPSTRHVPMTKKVQRET